MDAFTPDIIFEPLPQHFKAPTLEMYDGTSDPDDHLESFRALMILYGYSDVLTCRTFQATFRGAAHHWFSNPPPRSISSWEQFANLFLARFINNRRCYKSVVSLMSIKQKQGESLRSYIDRYKKEELEVRDLNPMVSMHAAINGLSGSALKCLVAKTPLKTKLEFLKKAQKYIATEEASAGDHQEREVERPNGPPKKKRKGGGNHHNNNSNKDLKKPPALAQAYSQYMPLNSTRM
ncbi:PREDICTED: uncharacterized protein LOC104599072 [Nelumbo nucifera]|uniref:Uncharacterized protein LOC104599072 n=1 Tax=Nelumbo nucifera TaxID=4432 RepID=A0A1U7ZYV0_NELNU|nr:PREDICTED: uncharacterized protein LOC104599072 [Nelumbo nucifera]